MVGAYRLGEEHELGAGGERAGECDALLLTAGELVREPALVLAGAGQTHLGEHLGHAGEARRVEQAVAADLAGRGPAPRSTAQVAEALLSRLG